MKATRSPRPVVLAVDDDAHALAKIEGELSDRYGKGYRVVCEASAEMGIVELERCKANGEDVALVLADQWIGLVAQYYCRVARYGGEDASRVESGLVSHGDHKSAHGTNRIGPGAPCASSWSGV
jgi:hypothetical protein